MTIESTHEIGMQASTVVKRFRRGCGAQAAREWRALSLLHEHAPGLAPRPIRATLDDQQPAVVMSRLPGQSLKGPVTCSQLDEIARAFDRVHHAPPIAAYGGFERTFPPEAFPAQIQEIAAACPQDRADPLTRHALQEFLAWLATDDWTARLAEIDHHQVFAQGDGNLANFLWDGTTVQVVDFEDSGPSSRAQALADFTEHLTVWAHGGVDADDFLGRFDLNPSQRGDVLILRRIMAAHWLTMLVPGGMANHRNPAGTEQRAAGRLLDLLT